MKRVLLLVRQASAPPPAELSRGATAVLIAETAADKLVDLILAHDTVIVW